MFGLIKFAAYALLGYFLYEMILGVTDHSQSQSGSKPTAASKNADTGHFKTEPIFDQAGGRRNQKVGRGVLS